MVFKSSRIIIIIACLNYLLVGSAYGFSKTIQHFSSLRKTQTGSPMRIFRASSATQLNAIQTPLIAASDSWGNIAALTGTATLSQVIGKSTTVGRLLGPPVTAMALTFVMASIGILNPGGTAASKSLQLLSLQLATPLILLGADLRDCLSRCGPLLLSFLVAAASTVVASIVGWSCFSSAQMTSALGKEGLIIAAALMAKVRPVIIGDDAQHHISFAQFCFM